MSFNIAIDGPAGAGKSTIAKMVAQKLNFIYVDTGAMYRSIALYLLENHINPQEARELKTACENIQIEIRYQDGVQQVWLNNTDVTGKLRTEAVGNMASVSSAYPVVRQKLLDLQRQLAKENDVIMDGRDIGTNVLPNAQLKIYLTASTKVRAKRRYEELLVKGQEADLEKIEADITDRDYRDMHRETAPLQKAEDAYLLDSSDLTILQVVEVILAKYQEKQ